MPRFPPALEPLRYIVFATLSWTAFAVFFPILWPLGLAIGKSIHFLPLMFLESIALRHGRSVAELSTHTVDVWHASRQRDKLSWSAKRASTAPRHARAPGAQAPGSKAPGRAQVNKNDKLGSAVAALDLARCKKLLGQGADPAFDLDGSGSTALSVLAASFPAAGGGDPESALDIARHLLNAKKHANASEILSLHYHANPTFVELLIGHGANVDHVSANGATALMGAAARFRIHAALMGTLLDAGAAPGASAAKAQGSHVQQIPEGRTPLIQLARDDYARVHDDDRDQALALMVDRMVGLGADPDALDSWGWSALHHAAQAPNLQMIHSLLKNGAHPSQLGPHGETALDVLSKHASHDSKSPRLMASIDLLRSASERHELASATPAAVGPAVNLERL